MEGPLSKGGSFENLSGRPFQLSTDLEFCLH